MSPEELKELLESATSATSVRNTVVPKLERHFREEQDGQSILEHFGPENSIVWTVALQSRLGSGARDQPVIEVLEQFYEYYSHFDYRQLRYISAEFKKLYQAFIEFATANSDYAVFTTHILAKALDAISPAEDHDQHGLTQIHADLMEWAYNSKTFLVIQPHLQKPYYGISKTTDMNRNSVIQFFYFAGLILTEQEQYHRASEYFAIVFSVQGKNQYKPLAYYKWLLVNLLIDGSERVSPRSAQEDWIETYRKEGHSYAVFASRFVRSDDEQLQAFQVSKQISNNGDQELVDKCLERYRELKVANQRNVFSSLPMDQIETAKFDQNRNNLQALESYVTCLLIKNKVRGHLGYKNGSAILTFAQDDEPVGKQVKELERLLYDVADISVRLDKAGRGAINQQTFVRGIREYSKNRHNPSQYIQGGLGGQAAAVVSEYSSLRGFGGASEGRSRRSRSLARRMQDRGSDSSDEEMTVL